MMEWIDGNLGSQLTMKYTTVYMMEPGARGEILHCICNRRPTPRRGYKTCSCCTNTSGRIVSKVFRKTAGDQVIVGSFVLSQVQRKPIECRLRYDS